MKRLSQLLVSVRASYISAAADPEISALVYDSRKVGAGDCFFAVRGTASDGHDFISSAVERGAAAVVCQTLPAECPAGVCFVVVEDTNAAMAQMAAAFYDYPSRSLELVGVTGTNGKTTTATLLYDMFTAMGYKSGLISTVVYRIAGQTLPSTHTTPDAIRLNEMMRRMVDEGCSHCFMEVSSHSIVQHRIDALDFAGGIFTNLTHDHLDYHKTFKEYVRAKKMFFDSLPKRAWALTNIDDRNGEVMVQNCAAHVNRLSLRSMADFRARIMEMHMDGMELRIDDNDVWVGFLGRFNAYNLLSVYGAARLLGVEREQALTALSAMHSVSGRFEPITARDNTVAIVDYAHTPDALENVLQTIDEIRPKGSRLIVVCGCGGDRDRTKRPEMAAIAVKHASTAIFTSDNPRTEDPEAILADMTAGVEPGRSYLKITDRHEAIKTAVALAAAGDMILVAGKGHEDYQIVGTEKHHFDDREELREAFRSKGVM